MRSIHRMQERTAREVKFTCSLPPIFLLSCYGDLSDCDISDDDTAALNLCLDTIGRSGVPTL